MSKLETETIKHEIINDLLKNKNHFTDSLTNKKNQLILKKSLERLIEKNETFTPQYKDLCYCASGRKYKRCCLKKDLKEKETLLSIDEFKKSMLTEKELPPFFIKPSLSEKEALEWNKLKGLKSLNSNEFKSLETLAKNYSSPQLWIEVSELYQKQGNKEKGLEIAHFIVNSFPDSLLGQFHLARFYLLEKSSTKQTSQLINDNLTLHRCYPERQIFHLQEYLAFNTLLIDFHLFNSNLKTANTLFSASYPFLKGLKSEDQEKIKTTKDLLNQAKFIRRLIISLNRNLIKKVVTDDE
jgi:hypothetical protein